MYLHNSSFSKYRGKNLTKQCQRLFSFKLQIFPAKLDDGQWSCPICLITTFSYRTMKRHINTHTNSETFPCDSCGKIFSRKDSLTRHIKKSCTESNSFWKRPNKRRQGLSKFLEQNQITCVFQIIILIYRFY